MQNIWSAGMPEAAMRQRQVFQCRNWELQIQPQCYRGEAEKNGDATGFASNPSIDNEDRQAAAPKQGCVPIPASLFPEKFTYVSYRQRGYFHSISIAS